MNASSLEIEPGILFSPLERNIDAAAERLTGEIYRMTTLGDRLNNRRGKKRQRDQPPHETFVNRENG